MLFPLHQETSLWLLLLLLWLPHFASTASSAAAGTTTYPQFLTDNPLPQGYPWGTATSLTTKVPVTGVTRSYNWNITRLPGSPDGYNKTMVMVSGQFPGPLIEANWGDTISVTVYNGIDGPQDGTSIHWHGFLMTATPWYDGVPSVQQCPIAPGSSFTYTFQAETYGSTWWHSHYGAQYMDGTFGPLVIYGPTQLPYDIDLGPILINDWWHQPEQEVVDDSFEVPFVVTEAANNMINGLMNYTCNGSAPIMDACTPGSGIAEFTFTPGKTHRLRLINASGAATQKFQIDGYDLQVIEVDFVPVVPYTAQVITLGLGQRTDILVTAKNTSNSAVWMRSDIDLTCFPANEKSTALAAVYYPNADRTRLPNSTAAPWSSNNCANDALNTTIPLQAQTPPSAPAITQNLDITLGPNATNITVFWMNNSSFRADYNNPLLLLANLGNTSYPDDPQWNVYNYEQNTSIRIVLSNYSPFAHPIHLHGHNFWILAQGMGTWDGSTTNPSNPPRRDTQLIQPVSGDGLTPGYVVIEFEANNPGVWPLHCHIVIHSGDGLYANIMERPDLITETQIPSVVAQTCREWATWSGTHVVDQIDSGL